MASWPPSERALVTQGHGELILFRRPAGVGGDRLSTWDVVYDCRGATHEGHRDLVGPMGAEVGLCRLVLEVEDLRGEAADHPAHELLHVAAGAAVRLEEEGYEGHAEFRVRRAHCAAYNNNKMKDNNENMRIIPQENNNDNNKNNNGGV